MDTADSALQALDVVCNADAAELCPVGVKGEIDMWGVFDHIIEDGLTVVLIEFMVMVVVEE